MKLISLNTWGGKAFEPLLNFISENEGDTDIFCFQEILNNERGIEKVGDYRADLLKELIKTLPDFNYFFMPWLRGFDPKGNEVDFDLEEGLTIFVKKSITVTSSEEFELVLKKFPKIDKDFSNMPSILQKISLNINGKGLHIFTTHGVSLPGNKLDTQKRIEQSEKIVEIIKRFDGAKILCGDFNLMPETESIKLIDKVLRNLIKEFNIQNTRSRLSPYFSTPYRQAFADYTFVSDEIRVKSFAVPDTAISDHLPMILEFDL